MGDSGTKGRGTGNGSPANAGAVPPDVATLESSHSARADDDADVLGIGSVVGRYLVLERLGAGAMGVVYAAYDPELDRKVALKLLRPRAGDGGLARRQERLVREAKAIAKLSHPNIVGIFDVGVHAGKVFLAMEYLSGGTLKRWITAEKRPWRDVVRIFVEVGRGLAGAHAEGLIHRDFKSENVLLDKNGVAKVVDFGLVRLAESVDAESDLDRTDYGEEGDLSPSFDTGAPPLTMTGALIGTPAYMAPEQFLANPVDARTDQFAFCVSLYHALYGERPFAGSTFAELADAVTQGRVRPAPEKSAVPGWIRKVVLRGLAVDPAGRFASVSDLLQALIHDPVARRKRRVGIAAALIAATVVIVGVQRRSEERRAEFEQRIGSRLADGNKAFSEAQSLKSGLSLLRNKAFGLFDAHDREGGERVWAEARAASGSLDAALERAERALQAALALDQGRPAARHRLAEVLFERAALAELELRREDLARHLASLETSDPSGEQRQMWNRPGALSIRTVPAGAKINIERFERHATSRITSTRVDPILSSPVEGHALPPGSYRLRIEMAGHAETLYPFLLKRGETVSVDVPLPPQSEIPDGFRYVPAGRFLYGDHDEEWRLAFLNAVPLHERELPAFLIKSHETTFGEWIEFLTSLPPKERAIRMPASKAVQGSVALTQPREGEWKLQLNISNRPLEATMGQKIVYPGRPAGTATQDWLRMPVLGVSPVDMRAYVGWLAATGRTHGARLCKDDEWERAARGADERVYPSSLIRLASADANVDATYGRVPGAYGPDEVGRHPESRSPFGLDDMAGNAWEVVERNDVPDSFVIRSGGYYQAFMSARSTNREPVELETRSHMLGFRVCSNLSGSTKERE